MDAKTLARYKKVLLEEKQRVMTNSRASLQNNDLNVSPEDLPDETDLAANEISKTLIFKLRDRERQMLKKLDEALARIEDKSFGYCLGCEEGIELRRLEARPMSTLCLSCKELEEHREKIYA